jgi:hypothetical protein
VVLKAKMESVGLKAKMESVGLKAKMDCLESVALKVRMAFKAFKAFKASVEKLANVVCRESAGNKVREALLDKMARMALVLLVLKVSVARRELMAVMVAMGYRVCKERRGRMDCLAEMAWMV